MDDMTILTGKEIKQLVEASKKMPDGTVGKLKTYMVASDAGQIKFWTKFTPSTDPKKTFEGRNEGGELVLCGEMYPDALKKEEKPKFSLKRNFFTKLAKIKKDAKLFLINLKDYRRKMEYDAKGRLFFRDEEGNIYYVNRKNTGAINKYCEYFKIIENEEYFSLEYHPEVLVDYFDFQYISEQAFLDDVDPMNGFELPFMDLDLELEEEEQLAPSNVIDFMAYKNSHDEGPHR